MKAAVRYQYGPPQNIHIEDRPIPTPSANQMVVRVMATTISRTDCGILWGQPLIIRAFTGLTRPRLQIPGTDFAGEVIAVGNAVERFKPGDRIWGFHDEGLGTQAQYIAVRDSDPVLHIPAGISFEHAVASAEGAHYALNFINKMTLQPGNRVLVYGATGAIGSAAVQLLANQGVVVTAVCATPHLEKVAQLGAAKVIDYVKEDFTRLGNTYNAVFDAVGKRTFWECKKVLKPNGVYVSSELGPGWQNPFLAIVTPLGRGRKVVFPLPLHVRKSLATMNEMLANGKFKPLIDRYYGLSQLPEAYDYVRSGQKIGNVIWHPQKDEHEVSA